ncbi:MAG TPA: cytochrome P450 [Myxococcaceae bacterium]|nr:cytochrome P450 [Myxococcaceae bacterium]
MPPIDPPDLASPGFKANPFPLYARLRAEAPVYRVQLPDKQRPWLVTRYDDVVSVLKDPRFGRDRMGAMTPEQRKKMPLIARLYEPLSRSMLGRDPPDHTRLRALVHQAFTPRFIEQLRGRIQELADELLTAVQRKGSVDLLTAYALPLPLTVISEMLGVPPKDRRKFQRWADALTANASLFGAIRLIPVLSLLTRYTRKFIEERRSSPGNDLISALVQAEESGETLNAEELLGTVFLLLVAGYKTTVNLIANGAHALLQEPGQLERLRADPALITSAVEEILRYTSPVDMTAERVAREDVEVAGTRISRGEMVLAVLASANRDEQQFANPDVLDVAREPNKHVAFGSSIHFCLGAHLARLEGQIALQALFQRMPHLRFAKPPESLRWRARLNMRGLEELPVTVKPP